MMDMRRGLDPYRQELYDTFAAAAIRTISQLLAAADSPNMRWAVQALGGPDPEPLLSKTGPDQLLPIRCGLVPIAGLGAFTAKAEDGWRIAVHEHTPQLLSAFTALVSASAPNPEALDRILDVDTRQAPSMLLDVVPDSANEEKAELAKAFSDAALLFVLSHEFGHVLLGHVTADGDPDPRLAGAGVAYALRGCA